jgi:hypothetical protein
MKWSMVAIGDQLAWTKWHSAMQTISQNVPLVRTKFRVYKTMEEGMADAEAQLNNWQKMQTPESFVQQPAESDVSMEEEEEEEEEEHREEEKAGEEIEETETGELLSSAPEMPEPDVYIVDALRLEVATLDDCMSMIRQHSNRRNPNGQRKTFMVAHYAMRLPAVIHVLFREAIDTGSIEDALDILSLIEVPQMLDPELVRKVRHINRSHKHAVNAIASASD